MFKDCLIEVGKECFDSLNRIRMEEVDRISELPEPILHHILSYLPFKQVAQTSVLSKTWERTWRRYPILEFDGTILTSAWFKLCLDLGEEMVEEVQKKRKWLFNCLEKALRNRYCREMISIKKFTIDTDLLDDPEFASFVDRCICFAVGSDVKELTLKFVCRSNRRFQLPQIVPSNRQFKLPQIVLCSGSIELLTLQSCKLELPRSNIRLSSLKKLFLSDVSADDHMIVSLVSGCPMIEDLHFHSCRGLKSLELSGLSRLNEVRITENTQLQQLYMEALNIRLLDIFWASAMCEINVAYCDNIRNLSLNRLSLEDKWVSNFISQFPLLEILSIFDCFELQSFKISSPCLKELCLSGCSQLFDLQIDAPNLHAFTYFGKIISLSSLNALALSKVDLELQYSGADIQWFAKYIEFLAKFRPFPQVLHLQGTLCENTSVPRKLRIKIPSPLSNIKHLNSRAMGTRKIAEVVDDLLWISPHTQHVSIKHGYLNRSFEFQFSYKKQLVYQGKFVGCCKSHPISCWQSCMKGVKLDINVEKDDCKGKIVESYTLKGANIFEQIDTLCGAGDKDCKIIYFEGCKHLRAN